MTDPSCWAKEKISLITGSLILATLALLLAIGKFATDRRSKVHFRLAIVGCHTLQKFRENKLLLLRSGDDVVAGFEISAEHLFHSSHDSAFIPKTKRPADYFNA